MVKTVIMFSGFKNSGKDTSSEILSSLLVSKCNSVQFYSFATPIKRAASVIFDIPFEVLEGKTVEARRIREEEHPFWSSIIPEFTPRKSLTMIGTDVIRKYIHDDIWILNAQNQILNSNQSHFIITDLREPNEEVKMEQFCKEQGIKVLHINVMRDIPVWHSYAVKAWFDDCSESLKYLDENGIHASEWKQVGLTPDHYVYNNSIDYTDNIRNQLSLIDYE